MTGELQAKGGAFVPFPSHTKNPLAMALNTRRLAHLIAAESADIVHVRSRALAWVALGATRMTKTPLVTSFHSGCQGSNPITMRYNSVLARGDAVLADTRFMADLAGRLYAPAAEKTRVIHQGIDCRIFSPDTVTPDRVQAVRRHWKVAPHEQIVLLAAQTSHASGHKILIEAARLLSRSGLTGVKFILACERKEGALDRAIDRAIAREKLQGIMYRAPHSVGQRHISRPRSSSCPRPGRKPLTTPPSRRRPWGRPLSPPMPAPRRKPFSRRPWPRILRARAFSSSLVTERRWRWRSPMF